MPSTVIQSPFPGTFYRRAAPDMPPFVSEGDHVASGTTLCLIEVMKTFQEIKAQAPGIDTSILAEDEQFIVEGEDLITLDTE